MKKRSILQISLVVSLVTTSLIAKNHIISLDEAIDIALHNNAKLRVSQTSILIADTMYNQAMSANYPTFDVDVSAMRLDEAPTFEMRGNAKLDGHSQLLSNASSMDALANTNTFLSTGVPGSSTANVNAANVMIASGQVPSIASMPINLDVEVMGRNTIISKINMKYPLYTGGKISAIIKQAGLGKKIAQEGKRRTNNEVVFDVKRYYYGVLLTKQLNKLSSDTLERMGFLRDLTSRLYQGGSMNVKKTDYLRSKLSVNVLESLHEDLIQKELMAKAALIFAMGLPWSDTVEINQVEFKKPVMDENLEALIQNAYTFNPDYATLKIAIDIHDAKIDEAQSDYLPSIGIMASAQHMYNDYEYGFVNKTNKNSWTLGVGVQWSLFNGMRTTNKVEQSRLEKLKLKQQEIVLQDGLALGIKHSFLKMKSSYKQYNILLEASQTAEENRDLNTRAYQEDMVETKDVIESQLFESFTFAAFYRSLHEHAISRANTDFIVGKALERELIQ